jgi:hypothetical protein
VTSLHQRSWLQVCGWFVCYSYQLLEIFTDLRSVHRKHNHRFSPNRGIDLLFSIQDPLRSLLHSSSHGFLNLYCFNRSYVWPRPTKRRKTTIPKLQVVLCIHSLLHLWQSRDVYEQSLSNSNGRKHSCLWIHLESYDFAQTQTSRAP